MLLTDEQKVYFFATLVIHAVFFWWGLDFSLRFPNRTRKAIAEGKSHASEKTVRLVRGVGLFLVVYGAIGILYMLFLISHRQD